MKNYKVEVAILASYAEQIRREIGNMRFCVEEIQKKIGGLETANLKEIDEKTFFTAADDDIKGFFESEKYLLNALFYFLPDDFDPAERWEDWKDLNELGWNAQTWQKQD